MTVVHVLYAIPTTAREEAGASGWPIIVVERRRRQSKSAATPLDYFEKCQFGSSVVGSVDTSRVTGFALVRKDVISRISSMRIVDIISIEQSVSTHLIPSTTVIRTAVVRLDSNVV